MKENYNDEPEEIIITGDGKENTSNGENGEKKNSDNGSDSDSDGDGMNIDKDTPEEGVDKGEGGEGIDGKDSGDAESKPNNEKDESGEPKPKEDDGDEEDDETIETVDCAIITGLQRGLIGKVDKEQIKVENQPFAVLFVFKGKHHLLELPLREIIFVGDYVAYKKSENSTAVYVGEVLWIADANDVEKNQLSLSVYNPISAEYEILSVNVLSILHKMPNCAIIRGRHKGRVGCFYEGNIDDLLNQQYIELFENNGSEWRGSANESSVALFERDEFVTFGDKAIIDRENRLFKGVVEARFISWGMPINCDGFGHNYVWFGHEEGNNRLWEMVKDISEVDPQSDGGQDVFQSMTTEIVDDIIGQFKEKGTFPIDRDGFIYCHFPKAIRKSIVLLERANGMNNKRLEDEINTTLITMIEFDREVAKSLLRHIQISGYDFDPIYGFSSIFYNCLKELGVFSMANTVLVQDNMNVVSIYRDKNKLFFYSTIGYIFMEEIIFGDRKNITKFALWQNERAERIDALYCLLYFLVNICRDKENRVNAVKYPEINEEIGRIFLLQLKALEDAI